MHFQGERALYATNPTDIETNLDEVLMVATLYEDIGKVHCSLTRLQP